MKSFEETDHDHAFSADTRGFMVAVRRRGFGVVGFTIPGNCDLKCYGCCECGEICGYGVL